MYGKALNSHSCLNLLRRSENIVIYYASLRGLDLDADLKNFDVQSMQDVPHGSADNLDTLSCLPGRRALTRPRGRQ
eukprot:4049185-Pyramimonas_sp.AAC.1